MELQSSILSRYQLNFNHTQNLSTFIPLSAITLCVLVEFCLFLYCISINVYLSSNFYTRVISNFLSCSRNILSLASRTLHFTGFLLISQPTSLLLLLVHHCILLLGTLLSLNFLPAWLIYLSRFKWHLCSVLITLYSLCSEEGVPRPMYYDGWTHDTQHWTEEIGNCLLVKRIYTLVNKDLGDHEEPQGCCAREWSELASRGCGRYTLW